MDFSLFDNSFKQPCAYVSMQEYRDHIFPCINICQVPRKLFEHEANRQSVKKSSDGPSKCYCNETYMCNECNDYSSIFYLIPIIFTLKTQLKHYNIPSLTLDFSKQNGVSCKLSNVVTS